MVFNKGLMSKFHLIVMHTILRYRDVMLFKCHQRCSDQGPQTSQQLFFLSLVIEEKCTRKCMKSLFGKPLQLPSWVRPCLLPIQISGEYLLLAPLTPFPLVHCLEKFETF